MSKLIRREDAIREMFRFKGYIGFDEDMLYRIRYAINQIPTIDAVPVVQCGECNRRLHLCTFDDGSEHFQCTNDKSPCFFAPEVLGTDYCPYGERGEATKCP